MEGEIYIVVLMVEVLEYWINGNITSICGINNYSNYPFMDFKY